MKKTLIICAILLFAPALSAPALDNVRPGPGDKCPVCGMFVSKYPEFLVVVFFHDQSKSFFDGPRDFFEYYLHRTGYLPGKAAIAIDKVLVTDYYHLSQIDGRKAWYVLGSDVNGPMGRELIPFGDERAARDFMKDHGGKRLIRFDELTPAMLRELK